MTRAGFLAAAWAAALVFPADFSATGYRSVTSRVHPGVTDTTGVRILKRGPVIRTEFLDASGDVVSIQISDLVQKVFRELDPRTKTYSEAPLSPEAETWMGAGFPIGKHLLRRVTKAGKGSAAYEVVPAWGAREKKAWDAARASMTIRFGPDRLPRSTSVKTLDRDGRLWKNDLTFEKFKAGRPELEADPPPDFQKLQQ